VLEYERIGCYCDVYTIMFSYPVVISTTVFSYSRAMQYHAILYGCYCMGTGGVQYPSNHDVL